MPSVLMACPTAKSKDYSLNTYLAAYSSMKKYVHGELDVDLYMVDNTDDAGEYWEYLLDKGIWASHIESTGQLYVDIDNSWQYILDLARREEYDYIFSLEVDIIAPPQTIYTFHEVLTRENAVMLRHAYPFRGGQGLLCSLGCIFMEADLVDAIWDDVDKRMDSVSSVPMHEERRFMHVAIASERPVLDVYNYVHLEHMVEAGVFAEPLIRHGHGIQVDSIDGSKT